MCVCVCVCVCVCMCMCMCIEIDRLPETLLKNLYSTRFLNASIALYVTQ